MTIRKTETRLLALIIAIVMGLSMITAPACAYSKSKSSSKDKDEEETEVTQPLTPKGNMSLVDNIAGESSGDKQFITVVSKNGNYFYIIIDHAKDGKNTVHFLNQVDEADLLSLIEEEEEAPLACSCQDKCAVGAINTACELCAVDMTECVGKEPEPEPEKPVEEDPKSEPEKENRTGLLVILLALALLGGGALFYLKNRKPKTSTRGNADLDDYDYGDEDEDDDEDDLYSDDEDGGLEKK